ncbi:MAG: hypothetical protein MJZ31_11085 [Bacteroidales bacterium]|nr:hypothetical protein [Bacteroidales bacterium]
MKKKAHSESEMVKAVKTLESGVSADTVAREFGISKGTLSLDVHIKNHSKKKKNVP